MTDLFTLFFKYLEELKVTNDKCD